MPTSYNDAADRLRSFIAALPNYTTAAELAPALTTALLTLEQANNAALEREEPEPPAE